MHLHSTTHSAAPALQMTHDPRLQLLALSPGTSSSAAAGSSFSDPVLRAQADPARWLEGTRPELDAYLQAMVGGGIGGLQTVLGAGLGNSCVCVCVCVYVCVRATDDGWGRPPGRPR